MKGYIVIVLPTNVLEVYEFEGAFGELLLTALEFILERDLLFVLFIDYKSNVLLNVQRIVERLGGEAGVESQLNGGCLFYFTLPVFERQKML